MKEPENVETIDEALTRIGLGKFQFLVLLILGLIHSCDAMEIMNLIFLAPFLTCYWKITISQSTILATANFIGAMWGTIFFGHVSDEIGRKKAIIISSCLLLYFGLLSVASPTIYWLVIIRCLVGFGLGGNSSNETTLMSEMTPIKYRGRFMVLFQLFFIAGSYLVTALSFLILPTLGWRTLLVFATIPFGVVLLSLLWVPESPRTLLLQNNKTQCIEVINKIAKINKAEGVTDIYQPTIGKSSFRDLVHSKYLSSTIIMCFIYFTSGLTFISTIFISPIIDTIPHGCLENLSSFSNIQMKSLNKTSDDSCCFETNWGSYREVLISTSGELLFLPISIIVINVIGRKMTLAINLLILSIGTFFLNFCFSSVHVTVILFLLRGSLGSLRIVSLIYATEMYPTSVRGLGIGLCGFFSRIGAILSSFLVNIIFTSKYSFIGGTSLLCLINFIAFVFCFILPIETSNRVLFQTADDTDSETVHFTRKKK